MEAQERVVWLRKAALLCGLVGFVAYINTLDCKFCLDDQRAIEQNPDLRRNASWLGLLSNDFWGTPMDDPDSHKSYRPLTVATFRLNYLLHELEPMGYHLVNVALHSVVCYLYVQLCGLVFAELWPALVAGLLFAVHPVHTEAVAGLVGRADVLASLFFLLSFFCYRKAALSTGSGHGPVAWLMSSALLALCSALSKETGITVVGVCVLYDYFLLQKMDWSSSVQLVWRIAFSFQRHSSLSHSRSPSRSPPLSPSLTSSPSPSPSLSSSPSPSPASPSKLARFSLPPPPPPPPLPLLHKFSKVVRRGVVLAAVGVAFLYVRLRLMKGSPHFTIVNNPGLGMSSPYKQLHWAYLPFLNIWLLLNPWQLSCEYALGTVPAIESLADPRNLLTLLTYSALGTAGVYGIARGKERHKVILFGLVLMALPFLPASNLLFPVGFVIAERVLYMPSMGFCLVAGYCVWRLHRRLGGSSSSIVKVLMAVLLLSHSWKTVARNRDWYSNFELYGSACEASPLNAKMMSNFGYELNQRGEKGRAEEWLRRAVGVAPAYLQGVLNLGGLLKEENRIDEAIHVFKGAAELVERGLRGEPSVHVTAKDHMVFNQLGHLMKTSSDRATLEEAHGFVRRAISLGSRLKRAHNDEGEILIGLNRPHEARASLRRSIAIDPEYALAHSNLGKVLFELGDVAGAEKHFRRSLELDPTHNLTKFRMADLIQRSSSAEHSDASRLHEAERLLLDVLSADPENGNATFSLALVYFDLDRHDKAEEYFLRALGVTYNHGSSLYNLGLMYYHQQRCQDAISHLTKLVEWYPYHLNGANLLATCYHSLKDWAMAEKIHWKVLEQEPNHLTTHHNLGLLYLHQKKLEKARSHFAKVLELDPSETSVQKQVEKIDQQLQRKQL